MENKRLLRSNNRMLAGVCAGIAEYFGWEVSTVRIVYALATIFTAFFRRNHLSDSVDCNARKKIS